MTNPKPTAISGIKPSGTLSLGNFIGAIRPFTAFQQTHHMYVFVADLHAVTVRQDPADLSHNTLQIVALYLAAGLDPAKCTLFVQSHIAAHSQLGWLLNTFTQMGELERMTQYKDKAQRHKENINAGLFAYPTLMAADILLYQPEEVPVGDDQTQHVELTRDIATRFNNLYGPTFRIPKTIKPKEGARIKDLQDPLVKMDKSRPGPGTILLTESPADAAKKIKRAVTDSGSEISYDPAEKPGVANLLEIFASCTGQSMDATLAHFAGAQYGKLKTDTADAVAAVLEPLQAEYQRLMHAPEHLHALLKQGADAARPVADATLAMVMQRMGFVPPAR